MQPKLYLPVRLSSRPAMATDRPAITSFLQVMLEEFDLGLDFDGVDDDINGLPNSYDGGYFGLVERDDEILGTFALYPIKEDTAEVRKMYLHPSLRGQGLGRTLLEFVESVAVARGFKELQLETASAMVAARSLYARAGYIEVDPESKSDRCDRRFVKQLKHEM